MPSPEIAPPSAVPEYAETSPLELLSTLLRYRRIVVGIPAALFLLTAVIGLLGPRTYSVSASFIPQSDRGSLSGAASLAAQFGVRVPGINPGETPDFYADLLRSDQLLRAVVLTPYRVIEDDDTLGGTLIDFYQIAESTPERSREAAVRKLRDDLAVSVALKTGMVTLRVKARQGALALQIADRALDLVNAFNLETRQTQAGAERKFIEERLDSAKAELRSAEDRLQRFLQTNRDLRSSPQLAFEYDRLQRDVAMRQQVYTTLEQGYEQARIDEVRNTPVITVVEQPILPARPDGRRLVLKGMLALILGGLLGVMIAFGKEYMRRSREAEPEEVAEYLRLRREAGEDLRRLWGRVWKRKEERT